MQGWIETAGKLLEVKVRRASIDARGRGMMGRLFEGDRGHCVYPSPKCNPTYPQSLRVVQREWDLALAHDMGLRLGVTKARLRKFKRLVRGLVHGCLVMPSIGRTPPQSRHWVLPVACAGCDWLQHERPVTAVWQAAGQAGAAGEGA